jgi:hypothetical protein
VSARVGERLAAWLLASAGARMGARRAEWGRAMLAEAEMCEGPRARLGWAWGCWVASLRAPRAFGGAAYGASLLAGLAAMTAYEWSADESQMTVLVLAGLAMALGALRPRQAVLSGSLLGLVVAGVMAFEVLSGIRPEYERQTQTFAQSIHWMILLVPSLGAAGFGACIGRRVRLRRRLG